MLKKMPRSLMAICTIVGIGLLTCGFTYAEANNNLLQFTGKENTEVTLLGDKQNFVQSNCVEVNEYENEDLEVGQVIVSNGIEEIVFAIGADGSYITIPASE